jgi:hypothetical protein
MSYEADVLKFKHPFIFCVIGPTVLKLLVKLFFKKPIE